MIKLSMAGALLVLCLFTGLSTHAGTAQRPGALNAQHLAKVVPGISKARVKELLGAPWRTVQYNDLDERENEFWEYRRGATERR
jgi:outer membrane protein assembly factor BamE (lipoprotein component of BamABCDE complex)